MSPGVDGTYQIIFAGKEDTGAGVIILDGGTITGVDVAGVSYTGKYKLNLPEASR